MTQTVPARNLHRLSTADLIAEYDRASLAVLRFANYHCPPRKRIARIVELLSDRADEGDAAALAWYEED